MSNLTFTKDEVELMEMTNVQTGAKSGIYYRWGEGDLRDDDQLFLGTADGPPSEHAVEQINKALEEIPNERIFFPLPIRWYFANTTVTLLNEFSDDVSGWHLKRPWFMRMIDGHPWDEPTLVSEWFLLSK